METTQNSPGPESDISAWLSPQSTQMLATQSGQYLIKLLPVILINMAFTCVPLVCTKVSAIMKLQPPVSKVVMIMPFAFCMVWSLTFTVSSAIALFYGESLFNKENFERTMSSYLSVTWAVVAFVLLAIGFTFLSDFLLDRYHLKSSRDVLSFLQTSIQGVGSAKYILAVAGAVLLAMGGCVLYMFSRMVLAMPALVDEDINLFRALGRSSELTDHPAQDFLRTALTFFMALIYLGLPVLVYKSQSLKMILPSILFNYAAVFLTLIYFDMKCRIEGIRLN